MKRKRRYLDGEANEQRHPNHMLETPTQFIERPKRQRPCAIPLSLSHEHRHIEGVRLARKIEGEHRQQHQPAAEKSVEKKLNRGVLAARSAPNPDQEVHRQKHHFPKDKEEEKVQRDEDAHHPHIQKQKQRKIALNPFFDSPRGKDTK